MTGIICPFTNENGYCDSTACHNMNVVGNIIPKERPENIGNCSIWAKPHGNWHTGTPTEEGFFAVYYYADNEYDYGFADWNGKYWEEHFSFDDVGCRIIAWQKIEPYKEKEE